MGAMSVDAIYARWTSEEVVSIRSDTRPTPWPERKRVAKRLLQRAHAHAKKPKNKEPWGESGLRAGL